MVWGALAGAAVTGGLGLLGNWLGKGSRDEARGSINAARNQGFGFLDDAARKYGTLGPQSLRGPGTMGINITGQGAVKLNPSGSERGFMNRLRKGLRTDNKAYGKLLRQLRPGFGALSQAAETELENRKMSAIGDLRDQMSKRRVLGASFAQGEEDALRSEYDQQIFQAKAEAKVQELQMTQQVINDRNTARLNTITQAFSQLNFRSELGANLMARAQDNMTQLKGLMMDLAKAKAGMAGEFGLAEAEMSMGESEAMGNIFGSVAGQLGSNPNFIPGGSGTAFGNAGYGGVGGGFGGTSPLPWHA